MKKIFKLSLILSSALILSACSLQKNSNNSNNNSIQNQNQAFSLKDLLAQGVSQKCSWTTEDQGQTVSGEIYIKGDKFKQTIVSQGSEMNTTVYTIDDGQYTYTWTLGKNGQGAFAMKMRSDSVQSDDIEDVDNEDEETYMNTDFTSKHQFTCNPENIPDDEFIPPSDVDFVNYDDFLNQMSSFNQ